MNKKKWDSLPPDVQKEIEKINAEWIDKTGNAWDQMDKEGKEFTLARGNQVIQLSKEEDERWANACKSLLMKYVETTKAKGLPGQDTLDFCLKWMKENP